MRWQVRYTWQPGKGVVHPKFSYGTAPSEEAAITAAVFALQQDDIPDLRLVEVHHRHISGGEWTKVEQPAPSK
jgi:hypothetical protein